MRIRALARHVKIHGARHLALAKIGGAGIAARLKLGEHSCVRLEPDVAPQARYVFAMHGIPQPRTLGTGSRA